MMEGRMDDTGAVRARNADDLKRLESGFRSEGELSNEQLTDPDYRIRVLSALTEGKVPLTCSRCHHCRR